MMTKETLLERLKCDFSSGIHPSHEKVFKGTIKWAQQFGLGCDTETYEKLIKTNPANNSSRWLLDGFSEEGLQLATDFTTWLYLHDDWLDEAPRNPADIDRDHDHMIEILHGGHVSKKDHPLLLSLNDICNRLRMITPDISLFIDAVTEYLSAKSWECRLNMTKTVPDLDTYIQMRSYGYGNYPAFEIGCIVGINNLPLWLRRGNAHIETLTFFANNLICWANDIVSYKKEIKEGITINLILVIQNEKSLSLDDSLSYGIEMWNKQMKEYIELTNQFFELPIAKEFDLELKKYIYMLNSAIRGHIDYSATSERFF